MIVPLVWWHLEPRKTYLRQLQLGAPLLLRPEPENPYDRKAVTVHAMIDDEETPGQVEVLLGYVADSDGKYGHGGGNREVAQFFRDLAPPWPAALGELPTSRGSTSPAVVIGE